MDFNNLLSQFSSMLNCEKNEAKPSGQNLCFYPDDFSTDFQKTSVIDCDQKSDCTSCNQNPLACLSKILPLLALFKGGKKVKTESLISQIASLSPEFSKFEPLIKLLGKSEAKEEIPKIDSYKKIEQ